MKLDLPNFLTTPQTTSFMKKQISNTIVISCLAGIVFTGCGKKYDPGPVSTSTYTVESFLSEVSVKPKKVKFNAASGASFYGNSGTHYEFQPSSFTNAAGVIVTGDVDVSVSEFLNRADMLFSSVLPITATDALVSGGEILVTAQQGGEQLNMAPGKLFTAKMPMKGTDAKNMTLFTGVMDNGRVVWRPADSAAGPGSPGIKIAGDTVEIISGTVGYCNADRFMTSPNYQQFNIIINTGGLDYDNDSLTILTLYDEFAGVWPCRKSRGPGNVYQETHVPNIPVHFVAYVTIKGRVYGGILGATPVTGSSYTVTLTPTTSKALKAEIDKI